MYCIKCGTRIPDDSRYCYYCGAFLSIQADNQSIGDQINAEKEQQSSSNSHHFDKKLKDSIDDFTRTIGNAGKKIINRKDLVDALVADLVVYLAVLSTTADNDTQLLSDMMEYYFDINMGTKDISDFISRHNLEKNMYLRSIPASLKSIVSIDNALHDFNPTIKSRCCELLLFLYQKIGEVYIYGSNSQDAEQFLHSYLDLLRNYINREQKTIMQSEETNKTPTITKNIIMNLSGVEFENLCSVLLEKMGFKVKTTKASADGGIDLIAWNNEPLKKGKYIIQCKRYTGSVGEPIIRDLYGVVMSERANNGILITTGNFTTSAIRFAENKQIELIDGKSLAHLLTSNDLIIHGKSETYPSLIKTLNGWFEYDALDELLSDSSPSLPHYSYYIERLYDLFIFSCTRQYGILIDDRDRTLLLQKIKTAIKKYKELKVKNDHHYDASVVVYYMAEAVIALYEGDVYTAIERTLRYLSSNQITDGIRDAFMTDDYICHAMMNAVCLFNILGLFDKTERIYRKYHEYIEKIPVLNNDHQRQTFKENPKEYMTYIVPCFNYSMVDTHLDSKPSIDRCEYNACTWEHEFSDPWGKKIKNWIFFPHSIEYKVLFSEVKCWDDNIGFTGFTLLKKSVILQQKGKASLLLI